MCIACLVCQLHVVGKKAGHQLGWKEKGQTEEGGVKKKKNKPKPFKV